MCRIPSYPTFQVTPPYLTFTERKSWPWPLLGIWECSIIWVEHLALSVCCSVGMYGVKNRSWCTAFSSTPSGLATYFSLVDSLSLQVRLSLSARRDLQYNRSSLLGSYLCAYMCVGTLPHCGHPRPRSIKPFLPPFLSWRQSREKRYQALSRLSVLQATESWAGPGNEATNEGIRQATS